MPSKIQDNQLLDYYAMYENVVSAHLRSYNSFVKEGLKVIIDTFKEIKSETSDAKIVLEDFKIMEPKHIEADGSPRYNMSLLELRLRKLSYFAPLYVKMALYRRGVLQEEDWVYVANIPVMVKSDICILKNKTDEELREEGEDPLDLGGYFILIVKYLKLSQY